MSAIHFVAPEALLEASSAMSISAAARLLNLDRRDLRQRLHSAKPPFPLYQLMPRVPAVNRNHVLAYLKRLERRSKSGDRRVKQRATS